MVGVGVCKPGVGRGVPVSVGVKVGKLVAVGIDVDTREIGELSPVNLFKRHACNKASRPK